MRFRHPDNSGLKISEIIFGDRPTPDSAGPLYVADCLAVSGSKGVAFDWLLLKNPRAAHKEEV